jgi:hypothetical protein
MKYRNVILPLKSLTMALRARIQVTGVPVPFQRPLVD